MIITWRGTASISLKSTNCHLEFDPYGHPLNMQLPPLDKEDIDSADAIFISHPHLDHFSDIQSFAEKAPVYVSQNGIDRLKKRGGVMPQMIPVKAGDFFRFGDLSVKIYQSRHCKYNAGIILSIIFSLRTYRNVAKVLQLFSQIRQFPIKDDVYMFEIQAEGKRVCIMGTAGLDDRTQYPVGADLVIFPYQGRTDMATYSLPLIERLQPKRVLFDHIDDAFPPFTDTVNLDGILALLKEKMPSVQAEGCVVGRRYEI